MPLSLRSLCLKDETNISEYNGILFSHEKERISDTCYNIDEPWGHAKRTKPNTKDNTLYGSIYKKCLEQETQRDRKSISGWGFGRKEEWLLMGMILRGVMKMFSSWLY